MRKVSPDYKYPICKICDFQSGVSYHGISRHLRLAHSIKDEEYYNKYVGEKLYCKYCGDKSIFLSVSWGYQQYCSKECAAKIVSHNNITNALKNPSEKMKIAQRLRGKTWGLAMTAGVYDEQLRASRSENFRKIGRRLKPRIEGLTKTEYKFYIECQENNILLEKQKKFPTRRVDFFHEESGLIFELDGINHYNKDQQIKDKEFDIESLANGYPVIHIENNDLLKYNYIETVKFLIELKLANKEDRYGKIREYTGDAEFLKPEIFTGFTELLTAWHGREITGSTRLFNSLVNRSGRGPISC